MQNLNNFFMGFNTIWPQEIFISSNQISISRNKADPHVDTESVDNGMLLFGLSASNFYCYDRLDFFCELVYLFFIELREK